MKSRIVLLTAGLVAMSLSGCYKDIISPGQDPNAPPQNISFSGDLLPIFEANCTTSGCHDAVPGHNPSLVKENAYNAITAGGYVNTVVPAASKLYGEVKGGSMPPTGALNAKDVQKILDWIRNGAPNN